MKRPTPWDDIQRPDADYNVRRTANAGLVPTYWGKDVHGHCLFVTELKGSHVHTFRAANLNIQGIDADLRQRPNQSNQTLVLKLVSHINEDLFHALCETLAQHLSRTPDGETAMAVAISNLKRWQKFLAGNRPRLLSSEEIRGLFAELTFLQRLLDSRMQRARAVAAWLGPTGTDQDFVFGNVAVEVKALSHQPPPLLNIASENQLESAADYFFLVVIRLAQQTGSAEAHSLNDLVLEVAAILGQGQAREKFESSLTKAGYVALHHYDQPLFEVADIRACLITGAFPRITSSTLCSGISQVRYRLHTDAIKPFECPLGQIWENC